VHRAAELWDDHLGERLSGVYFIGSLAHGGYSERFSDIDVALISKDLLSADDLDAIHRSAALASENLARKLSLFWADEAFSGGRFPILDQVGYLDHRLPVLQRRQALPARATLSEVRSYLAGTPWQNWSEQVARFCSLEDLPSADTKRYLRTLLYPARYVFSWHTGTVCSNHDAVAFSREHGFFGASAELIKRALHCRTEGNDPTHLWAERDVLGQLRDICLRQTGAATLFRPATPVTIAVRHHDR
jgi:hypothetical protein